MQSQKLPLWQLFYSPAQSNGICHRPASPGTAHTYVPAYTAHSAPVTRRSSPGTAPTPARTARHTDNPPGIPAQGSRHKAHATHAAPGSRIRLVRQSRPHRCGRLPFSRRASPRGTTLPGDPLILRRPHSFPETRIRPRNHSFSGKPCALRRISAPSGVTKYTPVDSGVMWPMTSTHPMRITCSCKASGTVNNNS